MNGKDSTLEEIREKVIGETRMSIALLESMAVSEYKAILKKRIEALEQFTTESAFASDDFDEKDTWISRKVVLAEIEKD